MSILIDPSKSFVGIEFYYIEKIKFSSFLTFWLTVNTCAYFFVVLPVQMLFSFLYAPFHAIRHAAKYGWSHVLAYPSQYSNVYKNGVAKNTDPLHSDYEYKNVYYFCNA